MSTMKHQKDYNKKILNVGRQANTYWKNALSLINKYTTDYAGRNEFWTERLNNRQLDLLSDEYLAQNAAMLRGQSAFGSNSATQLAQEKNAYSQQNYLANVANKNIELANMLQENELGSLGKAAATYQSAATLGAQAAQNIDAANTQVIGAIGGGMEVAGQALAQNQNPIVALIGGAVAGTGGTISGFSTQATTIGAGGTGSNTAYNPWTTYNALAQPTPANIERGTAGGLGGKATESLKSAWQEIKTNGFWNTVTGNTVATNPSSLSIQGQNAFQPVAQQQQTKISEVKI